MPDITLTVTDAHLSRIGEVAAQARAAGMHVDSVLDQVGVISGSAPDSATPALRALDGVAGVEPARAYRIAPPDSPVQ